MPFFTQKSLRQTVGSKSLGSDINKKLQAATGVSNINEARKQFAKSLIGKNDRQRESVYKQYGLGQVNRKQVEKVLDKGEKRFSKTELGKMREAEEAKKRLNVILSGESLSGGGPVKRQVGTSRFAGGAVSTRFDFGGPIGDEDLQQKTGLSMGGRPKVGHGVAGGNIGQKSIGSALSSSTKVNGSSVEDEKEEKKPNVFIGGLGAGV
jgi:hypothetical protein